MSTFQKWASFCLFSSFPHDTIGIQIDKSIDGVLGTRTWGGRIEGTDESTELHPRCLLFVSLNKAEARRCL